MPTCEGPFVFESNTVETKILDITLTKVASCSAVAVGKRLCYIITAENNSEIDLDGIVFRDELESGQTYVEGSFEVNQDPVEPEVLGNLVRHTLDIPAGETVEIKFCVTVSIPQNAGG